MSSEDWWRGDTEHWFTAWLKCKAELCGEYCAVNGIGFSQEQQTQEGTDWEDYFEPRHCIPMPDMFPITPFCPKEIQKEIREAFKLFWAHQASCAGRIRVALELLLDHLKVPKQDTDKHGKMYDLKLHGRIEIYQKQEPRIGEHLMALKWLGNSGSHLGTVSKDDLLDAFEVLEHALEELVGGRSKKIDVLANGLKKKHGR